MQIPEMLRRRLSPARRLEWYPPFRAMRVRVIELGEDWREIRLLLPLRPNRNPGGGMFGGAMACLADPIAALACSQAFPGYRVWTRELRLDFRHEGRSDLELRFAFGVDQERVIRGQLRARARATPMFEYAFFDSEDRSCVAVHCRVAIRPGDYRPSAVQRKEQKTDEPG